MRVLLLLFVIVPLLHCATANNEESDAAVIAIDAPPIADAAADAPTGECATAANGTLCGNQNDSTCDRADICLDGECVANYAAQSTPCGDQTITECTAADACDGQGQCLENHIAESIPCGDQTSNDCTAPDTCDGQGDCLANHTLLGAACGDTNDSTCDGADTCDGVGACQDNLATQGTACGDGGSSDCSAPDSCDGLGLCSDNHTDDLTSCSDCPDGAGLCASCQAGICENLCGPNLSDTTTFNSNNALDGAMFDVVAKQDIHVIGFDLNLSDNSGNPHNVLVYSKQGSYFGFEFDASAWTLLGAASVISAGPDSPTALPLALDVRISTGTTQAFYVTTQGTAMEYTNGTSEGAVYTSNASFDLLEGVGSVQNFGGIYSPRIFNGNVYYRVCE